MIAAMRNGAFLLVAAPPRTPGRLLATAVLALVMAWTLPAAAHERPDSFSKLAKELSPAVVNISTISTLQNGSDIPTPQFPPGSPFEDFFEDMRPRGQRPVQAVGTGFIIDASGIVVTNNHVIETADKISVILHDGDIFEAELVGRDDKIDIAVLRIKTDGKKLQAVAFGDSDIVNVGDWVMAIGNPFGLGGTVTAGIVSARGRNINSGPYDDFIQTDASINRGNSGGPLFNLDGEVIGVNTAIFSQTGGSVGIGFAISSNLATNVVDQLLEFGRTKRGWLGVYIQAVTPDIAESLGLESDRGALVASVHPQGPARKGGVESGDVIVRFDGKDIEDSRSLPRIVAGTKVDKSVKVEVIRNGERKVLEVTLGELEVAEESGLLAERDPVSAGFDEFGFTVVTVTGEIIERYNLPETVNGLPLSGVVVTNIVDGSPAAERGLAVGDVIRRVGQHQVNSLEDLEKGIEEAKNQGKTSFLLLVRSGDRERFIPMPIE